jgi:hypothetical protein
MASGWTPVSGIALGPNFASWRCRSSDHRLSPRVQRRARTQREALFQRRKRGLGATLLDLAPRDLVKLSLGGVVAAGVKLTGGEVLLDQSMLTGESVPIEAGPGLQTYAGALVRRGEAEAEVTTTGVRTTFGRTAELVRTAHVVSTQQKAVLRVVRNLTAFNGVVIMLLLAHSWYLKMPVAEVIPLVLTAILASIPVALPATFTLASALGALGPSRSWASFRPASRPWTKRRRWLSCAPTRPAHACCCRRLRGPGFGEGPSIPTPQEGRATLAREPTRKISSKEFRVREGDDVDLRKWPTIVDPVYKSREQYQELLTDHVTRLSSQQQLLYLSNCYAILLVFQAMDAAGKDGSIMQVMSGANPQGCEVFSFKHPSRMELQHAFLWRTTPDLPERGRIGILDRSC